MRFAFVSAVICVAQGSTTPLDAATASSEYSAEFVAKGAISEGSGYWCSSGMHASGDSVTFTGTTQARRRVLGVDVDWAYSPGEVKVLVSKDGANFEEAQCWRSTRNELTFKESIMFPEPLVALAVTLVMRSPRPWKYFGINRLGLITETGPVMLVSGMTSDRDEQCLVARDGLALEPCLSAIAAVDGREIFEFFEDGQLMSVSNNQCVSSNGAGGHGLSFHECLEDDGAGDKTSWELQENDQLKAKGSNACMLVQEHAGQTLTPVTVSATSSLSGHPPEFAVDGDEARFWSSQFDPAENEPVDVTLDFGSTMQVASIEVSWQYAARNFEIQLAANGAWTTVYSTANNNLNRTSVRDVSATGNIMRLRLREPHQTWGSVAGRSIFGIREIKVVPASGKVAVEDCSEAGQSNIAGDKFFAVSVSEFNSNAGSLVRSSSSLLAAAENRLGGLMADVQAALPQLDECSAAGALWCDRLKSDNRTTERCSRLPKSYESLSEASQATISEAAVDPVRESVSKLNAHLAVDSSGLRELVASSKKLLAETNDRLPHFALDRLLK